MLDIFVGTGVFGGVLWILFLANILRFAVITFIKHESYIAFWLILVIVAFSARMTVDSMGKDHLLQEFMFTAGLLYMLLRVEESRWALKLPAAVAVMPPPGGEAPVFFNKRF
ncbi:MAG: hypothetical protein NUV42_02830 [Candidatus Yonathbacteria bacterium]|nr:hypothetical protein [Candidatus Yonathbacteria bacterium]